MVDDLLEAAPCGFLSFGDDGIVTRVNAGLLDILERPREMVVGHHVEQTLTIGTRIFYQTHWFPLLRLHGHAEEIFLQLKSAANEPIGVLVNAVRRQRDGVDAYDCVLMRVRERQKYEDELLRARRLADQAKTEIEKQALELLATNAHLEDLTAELQTQQDQLQEQAAQLEETSEELRVANEDLLDRMQEAEELRAAADEANRAKSTFLAVMSHELRTPMNAIGGYVQLLEMGIHGPVTDAQHEALHRIDTAQRHLLRLINDVLNLARIEAGRVEYAMEIVSVAEMVSAVAPMIEPQLASRELGFAVRVDPRLTAWVDREKGQQVLLNLLGNAVKFTPPGGMVEVDTTLAQNREGVLIHVRDTGIGIPPEKLERVFEPFVQVDPSHTRRAQGTGLGLAISRDLALGMGGDLFAESTLGKGSVFTLRLSSHDPTVPRGSAAEP